MTFLRKRSEYQCDICQRVGFWDEGGWQRYCSLLDDESIPNEDIPCACSEPCVKELQHRVETGVIVLPRLRNRGPYSDIGGPGRGYGRFLNTTLPEGEAHE